MSVGPISRGINSLLGRLSSVGPQGPQGPGTAATSRLTVEGIKPLPQRPSFYQRYQQDAFESGPRRGGQGGRGGGLDLSGGQRDFGAQEQGQGQKQANAKQGPQAAAAVDPAQAKQKRNPVQVVEFRKGQPARERDEFTQQPQKAQGDKDAAQKKQNDKAAAPKKPQKPKPPPPQRAPKPMLGGKFKMELVKGELKVVPRSTAERKTDAPPGRTEADAEAGAAVAASQAK
jgi:hypothetical protein